MRLRYERYSIRFQKFRDGNFIVPTEKKYEGVTQRKNMETRNMEVGKNSQSSRTKGRFERADGEKNSSKKSTVSLF